MEIKRLAVEDANALPPLPGSYILILRAEQRAEITVGRLGSVRVAPGWYLYTGSALGTGGLRGRVRHHLRPVTRPHWHIDHLRQVCVVVEIWYTVDTRRREHDWATLLGQSATPIPGFGASDCSCRAHGFHQPRQPELLNFVTGAVRNV
jgi:Uri superfamily endonuclease